MSSERFKCELCGEPMSEAESMFKYHGYSGPCPKPPLAKATNDENKCRQPDCDGVAEYCAAHTYEPKPAE